MSAKIEIKDGDVFVPKQECRHAHRRVVGQFGGRVVYCIGADKNYACKRTTFLRWLRKFECKKTH